MAKMNCNHENILIIGVLFFIYFYFITSGQITTLLGDALLPLMGCVAQLDQQRSSETCAAREIYARWMRLDADCLCGCWLQQLRDY